MAKPILSTNYKDDILNVSTEGKRKYRMNYNDDGTVSFDDVTPYDQEGSNFGAGDINLTNEAVNQSFDKNKLIRDMDAINAITQEGYAPDALALKEVNNSLVSDIYVGDDGKLHKVQGGADTVLPFSSRIENIYHFSNVASNSNQTAPIDYKHIILEGASATPMKEFSINGTSYFSEFTKGEDSSNGERLFLNHDGKIGDILKGVRTSNSSFSILLIN